VGIPYQQWREWTKDRPDASEVLALHPDAPTRPSRFKGEGKGCWRITVPGWHPARLNELLPNRWQAHKLKKRDRSAIAFWSVMCNGPFVPEATGPRRVHLSITRLLEITARCVSGVQVADRRQPPKRRA
jgi:hypothetical protein